jgi:hypothetical protein
VKKGVEIKVLAEYLRREEQRIFLGIFLTSSPYLINQWTIKRGCIISHYFATDSQITDGYTLTLICESVAFNIYSHSIYSVFLAYDASNPEQRG